MVVYGKARKLIESMYEGVCTVYVQEKTVDPDTKETIFTESELYADQPCRLSFSAINPVDYTAADKHDNVPAISQSTKLFISPDVSIPAGSKIVVTQNNSTNVYSNSGESARYKTHQEIQLELFQGWA